ncbi:HTH-type transcriptional repressor YtrA [Rubripirellula lacrimiformis]|uniref:HTH-type transcriptional repressor YtrA n=1 Tax=Rubripirellula lacrimiformis TaxID=1930273 RepID=A0A517N5H2_9BACT|nr:GntR family transcriptional regulator [Rubripirellula lacrimiformis]QDT02363.1 HTH-type transcriptional repressor YtrA [Rubripirellula lacrimiformis]
MKIDPKSHTPIFQQIAEQLRSRIRNQAYLPGEMLPSLRSFAVEIGVNPNTIQRAYEMLEREGIVESRRGVGIFVTRDEARLSDRLEQQTLNKLKKIIEKALRSGVSPDRVRALFESSLRNYLSELDA